MKAVMKCRWKCEDCRQEFMSSVYEHYQKCTSCGSWALYRGESFETTEQPSESGGRQ